MKLYELFNQKYQKEMNREPKRSIDDDECREMAGKFIRQFCGSNAGDGDILKICEYMVYMVTMSDDEDGV
jgi:hypothetical protein